jgi:hypothetical protein
LERVSVRRRLHRLLGLDEMPGRSGQRVEPAVQRVRCGLRHVAVRRKQQHGTACTFPHQKLDEGRGLRWGKPALRIVQAEQLGLADQLAGDRQVPPLGLRQHKRWLAEWAV